ncbi:MAG: right-handed parallel beta-helix repeat-containing protein, partial [Bacteroidales bacterium]|nr:right-handed parallel beta-helix repeat-containing protein [Bacteroidales bacterium]
MKKVRFSLVTILCLAFFHSLYAQPPEVWVDDDFNSLTPGWGSTHFSLIQDGIFAVSTGGNVYVASGTYNENILISKSVHLLGAQAGVDPRPSFGGRSGPESLINANELNSYVIRISADNVEINGFTITGGTGDMVEESGAANNLLFRYNILYDDLLTNGDEGIQIKYSDGVIIEYNYAYNTIQDAFNLSSSTNGFVRYNEAHDFYSDNAVIYCYDATNISIIGNKIYDGHDNDGIKLGDSGDGSSGGTVSDNIVFNCAQDGITIYASGVNIDNNIIHNCSSENGAMYLYGANNSTITNNQIYDNDAIGLLLHNTSNVSITGNQIYNNDDWDDTKYGTAGIWLTSSTGNINIHQNSVYNNVDYGVNNISTNVADAANNWWGDASGPLHPLLNPSGSGNAVSDYVLFDPYCFNSTCSSPLPVTDIELPTQITCNQYNIEITVSDFNNIGAISTVLNFDPAILDYQGVTVNSAISPSFPPGLSGPGQFRLGYFGSAVSLQDDDVLFTLHFDLLPAISGNTTNLSWSTTSGDCEYAGPGGSPIYNSTFNDLSWTIPVRPVKNEDTFLEYCTIQAAIDDPLTLPGHSIAVAPGIYTENVVVNKSLSMQGANFDIPCGSHGPESVILGGTGIAFDIQSDGVEINGFEPHGMIGVRNQGHKDVEIACNQVQGDAVGIEVSNVMLTNTEGLFIVDNCVDQSAQLVGGMPTVGILLNSIMGSQAAVISDNHVTWPFYGYAVYNLVTDPETTIQGGTIDGVMQGISVFNVDLLTGSVYAPSGFNISDISMSAFSGSAPALPNADFHAGVYVFTGGNSPMNAIMLDIAEVSVDGTDGHKQDCAGLSFADFSTATATMQYITVEECTLTQNENRGINIRGANALVDIDACTLEDNGYDPYGLAGNDGFGIIVREGAYATVDNCFITNPLSVNGGYDVTALYTDNGTAAGATIIAWENSLSQGGNASSYLAGNSGGTLTATCNWWGTTLPASVAATLNGTVLVNPFLTNGTDSDLVTPGFQPVPLSCDGYYPVYNATKDIYYLTIQAAVLDANPTGGNDIQVASGTYNEVGQIVIDKTLSITGANKNNTIIKPTQNTGSSGDARGWWLVHPGITFYLSKVTLDGSGFDVYQGIRHQGTGNITNVAFKNLVFPNYAGTGVAAFGNGNVQVDHCTFSNIGRIGVLYFGAGISGSFFTYNTYTGKGDGDHLDYMVEAGAGANVAIQYCTVSENTGVASQDGSTSAGILVTTYYGTGTDASVGYCNIFNNTTGIAVGFDGTDVSSVIAQNNKIHGNDYGLISTGPQVNATDNWWGHESGPKHPVHNTCGFGDEISDHVLFYEWWADDA